MNEPSLSDRMASLDLYDILDVPHDATPEDIKRSYRELLLLYHPDKRKDGTPASSAAENICEDGVLTRLSNSSNSVTFMKVKEAYEVLSNPTARHFYDKYGVAGLELMNEAISELTSEQTSGSKEGDETYSSTRRSLSMLQSKESLEDIKKRVKRVGRYHEELEFSRLFNVESNFTFAWMSELLEEGSHEDYMKPIIAKLQYNAFWQNIRLNFNESDFLYFGGFGHIQSSLAGAMQFKYGLHYKLTPFLHLNVNSTAQGSSLARNFDVSTSFLATKRCALNATLHTVKGAISGISLAWQQQLSNKQTGSLVVSLDADNQAFAKYTLKHISSDKLKHKMEVFLGEEEAKLSVSTKMEVDSRNKLLLSPSYDVKHGLQTQVTWSYVPSFPDELSKLKYGFSIGRNLFSLQLGFKRAGTTFSFPIQLYTGDMYDTSPEIPLNLAAVTVLPPLLFFIVLRLWTAISSWDGLKACKTYLVEHFNRMMITSARYLPFTKNYVLPLSANSEAFLAQTMEDMIRRVKVANGEQSIQKRVADIRRRNEEGIKGLVILHAVYGHPSYLFDDSNIQQGNVIDVTIPLMSKVRNSKLTLSAASKETLIGFSDTCSHLGVEPKLFIRYNWRDDVCERIYADNDEVFLP